MAQSLSQRAVKSEAYWETLRDRINAGRAVDVVNNILSGEEVTPQQERAALFLINKLLPNLQAVAVQIQTDRPQTRDDINALLTTTGIRPDQVWQALTGNRQADQASAEIIEHGQDDPEGAPTPADGG